MTVSMQLSPDLADKWNCGRQDRVKMRVDRLQPMTIIHNCIMNFVLRFKFFYQQLL